MDELWRSIRLITALFERLSKYRDDDIDNLDDIGTLLTSLKHEIINADEHLQQLKLRRIKNASTL